MAGTCKASSQGEDATKEKLLRQVPWLLDAPASVLAHLVPVLRMVKLAPGALVYEEGEPGRSMFLIKRGIVETTRSTNVDANNRIRVVDSGVGSFFGDKGLIGATEVRKETVAASAACPVELWELTEPNFKSCCVKIPAFAKSLKITITDLYLENEPVDPSQDERRGISKVKRSQLQTLLGKDPAIVAIIHGLKGELSRYNGCIAQPELTEREGYFVLNDVTRFGKAKPLEVSLVLGNKNLMATEASLGQDDGNAILDEIRLGQSQMTQGNRGDALLALQTLSAQLRGSIKAAAKKGTSLKQLFETFDLDGNGTLSKLELKAGCFNLSIHLSNVELDLVWPYFDKDSSGSISLKEFVSFPGPKGVLTDADIETEQDARHIAKQQRAQRIAKKTFHGEYIQDTLGLLHRNITAWAKRTGKPPNELFAEFDEDNSGGIDVKELTRGLKRAGINVSQFNVKSLWLLLTNGGNEKVITTKLWSKFLTESVNGLGDRHKLTQDDNEIFFPVYTPLAPPPPVQKVLTPARKRYPWIGKQGQSAWAGRGKPQDGQAASEIDGNGAAGAAGGAGVPGVPAPHNRRASVVLWQKRVVHGAKKGDHNHHGGHTRIAGLMWANSARDHRQELYHPEKIVDKTGIKAVVEVTQQQLTKHWCANPMSPTKDETARPDSSQTPSPPSKRLTKSVALPPTSVSLTKKQKKKMHHLTQVREKQRTMLAHLESHRSRLNRLNNLMGVQKESEEEGPVL
jgi:Ca2+-binding EF-hand superfamily protein/CRP-like cAMP-binding protein